MATTGIRTGSPRAAVSIDDPDISPFALHTDEVQRAGVKTKPEHRENPFDALPGRANGAGSAPGAAPGCIDGQFSAAGKSAPGPTLATGNAAQAPGNPEGFRAEGLRYADPAAMKIASDRRIDTLVTHWATAPRETPEQNAAYGRFMANRIERAARDIATGKIGDLEQLWTRARDTRVLSIEHTYRTVHKRPFDAAALSVNDRELYNESMKPRFSGKTGTMVITTPMDERYSYIRPRILSAMTQLMTMSGPVRAYGGVDVWTDASGRYELRRSPGFMPGKEKTFSYELFLLEKHRQGPAANENRVRVSWEVETKATLESPELELTPGNLESMKLRNPGVSFQETRAEVLSETAMYSDAQSAFTKALGASGSEEALDHAFAGYWDLVAAAPDLRGSAAKAHFVLQAVLLSRGIDLPPAAGYMAPDLEAMSRSRTDWVAFARTTFGVEPGTV